MLEAAMNSPRLHRKAPQASVHTILPTAIEAGALDRESTQHAETGVTNLIGFRAPLHRALADRRNRFP